MHFNVTSLLILLRLILAAIAEAASDHKTNDSAKASQCKNDERKKKRVIEESSSLNQKSSGALSRLQIFARADTRWVLETSVPPIDPGSKNDVTAKCNQHYEDAAEVSSGGHKGNSAQADLWNVYVEAHLEKSSELVTNVNVLCAFILLQLAWDDLVVTFVGCIASIWVGVVSQGEITKY